MTKYQKKYKYLMILLIIVLGFCVIAFAGKDNLEVYSDLPVLHTGSFTSGGSYCGLNDRDRNITKDDIKAIFEKEQNINRELNRAFDMLKNKLDRQEFNESLVKSLIKQVYSLENEFYRNLLHLINKIKVNKVGISSSFVGRGPIFEQTPSGKAQYRP